MQQYEIGKIMNSYTSEAIKIQGVSVNSIRSFHKKSEFASLKRCLLTFFERSKVSNDLSRIMSIYCLKIRISPVTSFVPKLDSVLSHLKYANLLPNLTFWVKYISAVDWTE